MIFLDTSVLIESFSGEQTLLDAFADKVAQQERLALCSVVLHEWLRGRRFVEELNLQRAAFPNSSIFPFGVEEAVIAAQIYRSLPRARGREVDIMIAACSIRHDAALWTLNSADFRDILGLRLI